MARSLTKFLILLMFVLAFLFVFNDFYWIGIILFVIGMISLSIREKDGFFKKSFEEAMNAEGSYPEGKIKEYTKSASKQFAKNIVYDYNATYKPRYPKNIPKTAKGILDEINDLFK